LKRGFDIVLRVVTSTLFDMRTDKKGYAYR